MPVINRIAGFADEMTQWRRHLHAHPELQFDCHDTAGFVVARLKEFGITDIHEGIATSGVVAIIEGAADGPTIGLRADMDALPMQETSGVEYASQKAGVMHACGHDGHTTMLLGAAKYLAETRNFSGRVALIFQPAEEGGGGGEVMVREGILDTFDISQVYALHTSPEREAGHFATTPGPYLAAADTFNITITGQGGHAAYPSTAKDPIAAAVAVANALQTIVSRDNNPLDTLVISVTQIHAGTTDNVIPDTAFIQGTVRTYSKNTQAMVVERMQAVCDGQAASFGLTISLDFDFGYPPTVNDAHKAAFAAQVARDVAGADAVVDDDTRDMGAEDFSYLLEKRPGAYLYIGQGRGPDLHNTAFDFNDEVAPIGASFFARLVETAQPLK